MGGFGSGRQGGRGAAENRCPLDIGRLRRSGIFTAGWRGSWEWSLNGEKVSSIGIEGGRHVIVLRYRNERYGEEAQHIVEQVPIVWRGCRYGGQRPYFACPGVVNGVVCRRSVTKLYSVGKYYVCRHCGRLSYSSQSEDSCDRALRRANRIKQRLGGDPGLAASMPVRPKGMWRKTYERLQAEVFEAEARSEERLERVAALLMELDRRHDNKRRGSRKGYWQ